MLKYDFLRLFNFWPFLESITRSVEMGQCLTVIIVVAVRQMMNSLFASQPFDVRVWATLFVICIWMTERRTNSGWTNIVVA